MKVKVKRKHKAEKGDVTFRIIITNLCDAINDSDIEARTATRVHEAADEMYQQILKFWLTANTIIKDRIRQAFNDMKEVVKDAQKTNTVIENPSINGLAIPSLDFEINRCCDGDGDKEIISIKFSPRIINVDIDSFLDMINFSAIKVGLKYSVKIKAESTGIDAWEPVDEKVSDLVPEPESISDSVFMEFKINVDYCHSVIEFLDNEDTAVTKVTDAASEWEHKMETRNATAYFHKCVHDKLVGNPDYITSNIMVFDSLQHPKLFDDRKDENEIVKILVKTESVDISSINRIIYEAKNMTEAKYNNIYCSYGISCDASKINIIYPTNDLLTQSACIGFGRLVTMAYQTRHNKSVDDHARAECFERILDSINAAYSYDDNVIIIPNGFIRITDKKDNPYSDKKIEFLANFIMAAVFMNGGDFDYIPEILYIPDINEKEKQSWNNGWRF